MIDALKVLAIGDAHRQLELKTYSLPNASFAELHNALSKVRDDTAMILQNTFGAISVAQAGSTGPYCEDVPTLGTRFEVNTHNIIAMRSRHEMTVQIIVSVLRVK